MPSTVLIGLQWGDEGKGKIIDVISEDADVVARFQGGNNAGHTVEAKGQKFILHLIPSGIIREDALCVIGNGVVVNPVALAAEIDELAEQGVDVGNRLQISNRCQLVFKYHCLLDGMMEAKLGDSKIGTTKRGIGPAYADKVNRVGLRGAELCDVARLEKRFRTQAEFCNGVLRDAGAETMDIDTEWKQLRTVAERLAPMVCDTSLTLNRAIDAGKKVFLEGAQGTWLDVDFGTYPFVTSSNTSVGAACTGTGVPPNRIGRVLGVAKAYTTRVGEGPFPTELDNELGEELRRIGSEFGATTGRPRRCGWFDAVATRYAVMLNGVTDGLIVTKLDVLDTQETIRICTAYELDGKKITDMPSERTELERVVPLYEEMPGWQEPTVDARCWDDLPQAARNYLRRLEELLGATIDIISVGPRREQVLKIGQ